MSPSRLYLLVVVAVLATATVCTAWAFTSPALASREPSDNAAVRVGRMLWGSSSELFQAYPHLNGSSAAVQHLLPTVVGWQTKGGPSLPADWTVNETYVRLDSFVSWRLRKSVADGRGERPPSIVASGGLQCKDALHPPTNYPGCQIYINHK